MDAVTIYDNSVSVTINVDDVDVHIPEVFNPSFQISIQGDYILPPSSGSGNHIRWVAPSASASWMIPHGLGYRPQVTVLDMDGNVMYADIIHLSTAVVQINFSSPTLGAAELT
jgi:hypothetical protein